MRPFKLAELKKINELPKEGQNWLVNAESSIDFLRLNSESDEVVIYASGSSVLIHGVLAPTAKVSPPDGKDLQDSNIPMPDERFEHPRVWGGGEDHRIYLEAPLSSAAGRSKGEKS